MKRVFRALALLCFIGCLALAAISLAGCAANPSTGKTEFSPAAAYAVTTQPVVQAVAASTLPPWGSVILGGMSLAFLALSKTHDASTLKSAINAPGPAVIPPPTIPPAVALLSPNGSGPAPPR